MTVHAQPLQPPFQGPADGAVTDDGRSPAGQLPSPKALVGDGAVPEHLELPDIPVGGQDPAGEGDEQTDGQFGDCVRVAPRRADHGHSGGGGGAYVNVVRVATCCCHRDQWQFEDRGVHEVRLHHQDVGALGHESLSQPGPS